MKSISWGLLCFVWCKPFGRIHNPSSVIALLALIILHLHPVVALAQAPVITNQPVNAVVLAGVTTNLSVDVAGAGPFTYQWFFDGSSSLQSSIVDSNCIITTVAGSSLIGAVGTGSTYGNGSPATNVFFNEPDGIALDNKGNLFIADVNDYCIRKVDSNGIITTVAGTPSFGYSGDGGPATNAELSWPVAVAVDLAGDIFIADMFNEVIREVNTNGIISTIAGNGYKVAPPPYDFFGGYSGDGGPATNAGLNSPHGVAVDRMGSVFIADSANGRIRKVDTNGVISTVAGPGTPGYYGDGGAATNAYLSGCDSVSVDSVGNLFSTSNLGAIRKVDTNGIITTLAGNWTNGYFGDGGPATNAEINRVQGVIADAAGNLFISDSQNNRVRKVDTNGIITTLAGTGLSGGTPGDGGPAFEAELNFPAGLALDDAGNLFIADAGNNRIRKLSVNGSAVLTIANTGPANTGNYSVVVSNPYGSVTSSVVAVTVILPPVITPAVYGSSPNGGLTLNLITTTNLGSRVYCATNLAPPIQWVPIYTNLNGGAWQFIDTNTAGISGKYYRVSTP
jgi:sugar lactone lactonase YvrE